MLWIKCVLLCTCICSVHVGLSDTHSTLVIVQIILHTHSLIYRRENPLVHAPSTFYRLRKNEVPQTPTEDGRDFKFHALQNHVLLILIC